MVNGKWGDPMAQSPIQIRINWFVFHCHRDGLPKSQFLDPNTFIKQLDAKLVPFGLFQYINGTIFHFLLTINLFLTQLFSIFL